tara:strand:- start:1324 stop:2403 length:1080 start_codon:yes stop_codon:yes gene_type:complete
MKKLNIISLKYSPGLLKEMIALSNAAQLDGYEVNLLLNRKYHWLIEEAEFNHEKVFMYGNFFGLINYLRKISIDTHSKIIFYNFHPYNILLRFFKKPINTYVYVHEPWMPDKYKYGYKRLIMVSILEKIQKAYALFLSDRIVVPSKYASEKALIFGMTKKNSCIQICPLMIDIEEISALRENYFLFIGRLHGAKAFEPLLSCLKHESKINIKVLTTTKIPNNIFEKFSKELKDGRLKIIYEESLSENIIQSAIIKSSGVFKLDTLMTQSGVVPLSFGLSTPVIARNIKGFAQDIDHKINGYLIENDDVLSIIEAVQFVSKNINTIGGNARLKYEEKFSPNTWSKGWGKVLNNEESRFNI